MCVCARVEGWFGRVECCLTFFLVLPRRLPSPASISSPLLASRASRVWPVLVPVLEYNVD